MSLLPAAHSANELYFNRQAWSRERRRYQRILRRFIHALPPKRIARTGRPFKILTVDIDPSHATDITQHIRDLATTVRAYRFRRYFPLEFSERLEHGVRLADGQRVGQLLRYFDVEHAKMITRVTVAIG